MGSCCQPCEEYFSRPTFRKLLAAVLIEFVGTFFYALVFAMALGAALGNPADNVYAPLIIGLFVGAMTFAGMQLVRGSVDSTGHYNPAISIAIAMENPMFGWERLIYFVIFQLLGGLLGGMAGAWVFGHANFLPTVPTQTTGLLAEFLFAFIIVLVALRTVHKRDTYGFAIGAAVFAGMAVSRTVSGGIFNPAVAFGLYAGAAAQGSIPSNVVSNLFVYIFGPVLGAAAAVLFIGIVTTLQGPVGDDMYTSGEESDYKPEYKPSAHKSKPAYKDDYKPDYKPEYKPKDDYKPEYKPKDDYKPDYKPEQPTYKPEQPTYKPEQPTYKPEQPTYTAEPVQTYEQQTSGYVAQPVAGYSSGNVVQEYVQRNNVPQGYGQGAAIQGYSSGQQAGSYGYGQAGGIEMGNYVVGPNVGRQMM